MAKTRVALVDVNVLVALFDGAHTHHEPAHAWLGRQRGGGWATCPLVDNGAVRVLSHPAYPGRRTSLPDAISRLRTFQDSGGHEHWPDDQVISDAERFYPEHIAGHGQITDVYLLALAVARDQTLATFDRRISLRAVAGARPRHLTVITG